MQGKFVIIAPSWETSGKKGKFSAPPFCVGKITQLFSAKSFLPVCVLYLPREHLPSDTSGHQSVGAFLHTKQFSATPAGWPASQLDSDTT